jgi:hypothetical protein
MAKWLIRSKKLTHVDYSVDEISQLIKPHLPITLPITVPRGDGQFTLSRIKIVIPKHIKHIQAELLGGLEITYLGNPIYRAHLSIGVNASPFYDQGNKSVTLQELSITHIELLQDEYSILKDTSNILNALVPSPVLSMVTGTMKTAFNLMTGTTAAGANAYFQIYLSGSKQKILDYHQPQLEKIIKDLVASEDMSYKMKIDDWQERLFIKFGNKVEVEDGQIRFKF